MAWPDDVDFAYARRAISLVFANDPAAIMRWEADLETTQEAAVAFYIKCDKFKYVENAYSSVQLASLSQGIHNMDPMLLALIMER